MYEKERISSITVIEKAAMERDIDLSLEEEKSAEGFYVKGALEVLQSTVGNVVRLKISLLGWDPPHTKGSCLWHWRRGGKHVFEGKGG